MKTGFLYQIRNALRESQYKADREPWDVRVLYWAMRHPGRMYCFVVAAFILGAWLA